MENNLSSLPLSIDFTGLDSESHSSADVISSIQILLDAL